MGEEQRAAPRRVHLVDGTYELFRAHYSKRPARTDPAGKDVKATVGVVGSLLQLLHEPGEAVTHLAVAFDRPIESFRNERFAGYKDSSGVDPVLLAQLERVEAAVASLGVTVWSLAVHEADDALATFAWQVADDVAQVQLLTPDKDLAQVVRGERIVQVDRARGTVRDEAGVWERFGVAPGSIPDLLALVGDRADGLPGVPGVGARTAAALLARYDHLEAIPSDPAAWDVSVRGATRIAASLAEHAEQLVLWRELATLVADVPLATDLADIAFAGVPREPFLAWCDGIGADRLRRRPTRWA